MTILQCLLKELLWVIHPFSMSVFRLWPIFSTFLSLVCTHVSIKRNLPLSFIIYIQSKISFEIKIYVNIFYIQIWFKCEALLLFFQKEHFIEKIWKNYSITCFTHMTSNAISVDEIMSVLISIKTSFGILELGIRVAKWSYGKWRHTSNY